MFLRNTASNLQREMNSKAYTDSFHSLWMNKLIILRKHNFFLGKKILKLGQEMLHEVMPRNIIIFKAMTATYQPLILFGNVRNYTSKVEGS